MLERWQSEDPYDARRTAAGDDVLSRFNRAGVLSPTDVHVATRLCDLVGEADEDIRLAIALAVRSVSHGSVCLRLDELDRDEDLDWPAHDGWLEKVGSSPVVSAGVAVVDDGAIYLARFHREELQVRDDLLARLRTAGEPPSAEAAERIFPAGYEEQRAAAVAAATVSTTVLTGGPGTGKTTTVAGLLGLLLDGDPTLRVALAAPTGKAAARLQESIEFARTRLDPRDAARLEGLTAKTLHRLLVSEPGSPSRFRHHRLNTLPHDVIVVDETSMVSLTMMARLLEAVRPETRLILVGDPDQLASVEAGAVLADLATGLEATHPEALAALTTSHRFGGDIGRLADAIRTGDAAAALDLVRESEDVRLIDPSDPAAMARVRTTLVAQAAAVRSAAVAGDAAAAAAAAEEHRLLCGHRDGPYGAGHWNRQIERWLGEATGEPIGPRWGREWYAGRPILVSANDYGLGLYNGDTGVTYIDSVGGLRVRIGARDLAPSRLAGVETVHAMTVHKSQGSQARRVTTILPEIDSPLLTRELLYTAVTRAQESVTVVASPAAVEAAIAHRVRRASGLASRLALTETFSPA